MGREAALEHDFTLIVQVGNAPSTDSVEQCKRCGIVRHAYAVATSERSSTTVRWYRNGLPALPAEDCT